MGSKKARRQPIRLPQADKRTAPCEAEKAPLIICASKTTQRQKHRQALSLVFEEALAEREGTVAGAVGIPRFGKTFWMKEVLAYGFSKGVWSRAFVHDVKKINLPQYEGHVVHSEAEWTEHAEQLTDEPTVVFNGTAWNLKPPLQAVCTVAAVVAEEGFPVVVVADEVYNGTDGHRNWLQGPLDESGRPEPALYPWMMREGTSQQISTLWTTQIPQETPTEARVLSSSVALFHLEGRAAEAACDHFRLSGDGVALLGSLRKGEFVLFVRNRNWNGIIYEPEATL